NGGIMKKLSILLLVFLFFSPAFSQVPLPKLIQKVKPCVFKIITYDRFNSPLKQGTGFFIDSLGTALSNSHVFENAKKAEVTLNDGRVMDVEMVLGEDKTIDIIKFKVRNKDTVRFSYLEFSNDSVVEGESIFVVGSPHGLEGTVSTGIISSIREMKDIGNVIQITAPISHGSSGSPVINMNGKVFGIATMIYESGQNLNFAIDVKEVQGVATDTVYLNQKRELYLDPNRIVYLNNGNVLTRPYFIKECEKLSKDKKFKFGGVKDFCDCYYDRLLSNYTDDEISDMIDVASVGALVTGSLYTRDEYFKLLKTCSSNLTWTKELEGAFYKTCVDAMERTPASITVNSKGYCACALEQIKDNLSIQHLLIIEKYFQKQSFRTVDNDHPMFKEIPGLKGMLEGCLLSNPR
ncbi:MAG TPA: S1C family serine protease, partial [Cytophagaceae bacterium]